MTMINTDETILLNYTGLLSQALFSRMVDLIESEVKSKNLLTIFIELTQNIINYSIDIDKNILKPEGTVVVSRTYKNCYFIRSLNIVSLADKEKIEPRLLEIMSLDKKTNRQRYGELRKSRDYSHTKGGGIGFYEIAKRCDLLEYNFEYIKEDRYYFYMKATLFTK